MNGKKNGAHGDGYEATRIRLSHDVSVLLHDNDVASVITVEYGSGFPDGRREVPDATDLALKPDDDVTLVVHVRRLPANGTIDYTDEDGTRNIIHNVGGEWRDVLGDPLPIGDVIERLDSAVLIGTITGNPMLSVPLMTVISGAPHLGWKLRFKE